MPEGQNQPRVIRRRIDRKGYSRYFFTQNFHIINKSESIRKLILKSWKFAYLKHKYAPWVNKSMFGTSNTTWPT